MVMGVSERLSVTRFSKVPPSIVASLPEEAFTSTASLKVPPEMVL